jgi:hypothetical protein
MRKLALPGFYLSFRRIWRTTIGTIEQHLIRKERGSPIDNIYSEEYLSPYQN